MTAQVIRQQIDFTHSEAERLSRLLPTLTEPQKIASTKDDIECHERTLKELMKQAGFHIVNEEKSRLRYQRGHYYTEENALLVKKLIDALIENGRDSDEVTTVAKPSTGIQILQQGLNFLCDNLDPSGNYRKWSQGHRFSQRKGRLFFVPRTGYLFEVGFQPVESWRGDLSRFLSQSEQREITLSFSNIQQFFEARELMEKYSLKITAVIGNRVSIKYPL